MATTAVVAEILIVGLEAEAWLALVIFMVFGSDWLNVGALGDFEALVTIVVIATAYVLGIVVDRAADSLFSLVEGEQAFRWLNRKFGRSSRSLSLPETVGTMRMRVLKDGGPIGGFLD